MQLFNFLDKLVLLPTRSLIVNVSTPNAVWKFQPFISKDEIRIGSRKCDW